MNQKAIDFIAAIASNMAELDKPLTSILDVLNDGAALASLGATDDDTCMIEDANAMVTEWLADGHTNLADALA